MNETKQLSQRISTKDLVLTGMFTAVICVMAQISIPTQPIPFTLSLFAIFLTGALLQPKYAFFSALTYLLLGAFGVPVFYGFKGGLDHLTGPTGGYLIAYPIMAFVIAISYKYIKKYKIAALSVGMVLALVVCYLFGTLWFTVSNGMGFYKALTLCVFPFIFFDVIKLILAISVSTVIRKSAMKYL